MFFNEFWGGGGYVELSFRFLIFLLRGLCGALCFVCYDWPNSASFRTVLLRRRLRRWPLHNWMFLLRFEYLKDEY